MISKRRIFRRFIPIASQQEGHSHYWRQFATVMAIEVIIVMTAVLLAMNFWNFWCDDTWRSCVGNEQPKAWIFIVLAIFRPFLFTPLTFLSLMGGEAFGTWYGTLLIAVGATLSCMLLFLPAKILGKRYVKPWLSANLPAMWGFIRTQDYKVVFAARLFPLTPFDLSSIVFGVLDFRLKATLVATFLGILPEAFLFAQLAGNTSEDVVRSTITTLISLAAIVLSFLLIYEFSSRRQGASLFRRLQRVYREILFELRTNNEIIKRHSYHNRSTPIVLIYGFFSTRRSLTVIERLLTARGFQVMSFNLGGLFGVFFTRGIDEAARFIDSKIKTQISRHGFSKVHLVCHSKGGLVAMWWLLKLGGAKYCDKLVTLGTPFKGSVWTYLALVTPLGFIWRDVWQMRPGSRFLRALHHAPIPENLNISCFYSQRDRVAKGEIGLFEPMDGSDAVNPVAMDHVAHFEFLFRRDVSDKITEILNSPISDTPSNQEDATVSDVQGGRPSALAK